MATSSYGTPPTTPHSLYRRRLRPHPLRLGCRFRRTDCANATSASSMCKAVTAHRLVVDQVRAVARRRGETSARPDRPDDPRLDTAQPSLEEFIAERGLDGWSEAEVTELCRVRGETRDRTRAQRRERLRRRQIELLRSLESAVAEAPSPSISSAAGSTRRWPES